MQNTAVLLLLAELTLEHTGTRRGNAEPPSVARIQSQDRASVAKPGSLQVYSTVSLQVYSTVRLQVYSTVRIPADGNHMVVQVYSTVRIPADGNHIVVYVRSVNRSLLD